MPTSTEESKAHLAPLKKNTNVNSTHRLLDSENRSQLIIFYTAEADRNKKK